MESKATTVSVSPRVPTSGRINYDTKYKVFRYFDEHKEDFRVARHGYLNKLADDIEEKLNVRLNHCQISYLLGCYRRTTGTKLELIPNKYYTSIKEKKRQDSASASSTDESS